MIPILRHRSSKYEKYQKRKSSHKNLDPQKDTYVEQKRRTSKKPPVHRKATKGRGKDLIGDPIDATESSIYATLGAVDASPISRQYSKLSNARAQRRASRAEVLQTLSKASKSTRKHKEDESLRQQAIPERRETVSSKEQRNSSQQRSKYSRIESSKERSL